MLFRSACMRHARLVPIEPRELQTIVKSTLKSPAGDDATDRRANSREMLAARFAIAQATLRRRMRDDVYARWSAPPAHPRCVPRATARIVGRSPVRRSFPRGPRVALLTTAAEPALDSASRIGTPEMPAAGARPPHVAGAPHDEGAAPSALY